MNWKTILILVVLVGIVLIICRYSCASRERPDIPWRPEGDRYKAPNVGFTNSDGSSLGAPYIRCSNSKEFTIYWVCDYSTTIYKPEVVRFNLTADIDLPRAWSGVINGNIGPSDTERRESPRDSLVYYKYTYQTSPDGIPPGSYTLRLNSFVYEGENVPGRQNADSTITKESMIVYDNKVNDVSTITVNDGEEELYFGEDIVVKWKSVEQSFPPPEISYRVSLIDKDGAESNIVAGVTNTSYTYSNVDLIGTYTALVKTINEDCKMYQDRSGSSSDSFTVDYPPAPSPTITNVESSCAYSSKIIICDDYPFVVYWCVDFTNDPEYNPEKQSSQKPNFILNITGDHADSLTLTNVEEYDSDNDGNILYYSYADTSVPGNYNVTVTTDAVYKDADRVRSDPSRSARYEILRGCEEGYEPTNFQCSDKSQRRS